MFYVPTEDDEMPPTSPPIVNKQIERQILSPRPAREPRYSNNNSFNSYTFSKSKNNTAATFNCCVCECEGTLQDTVQ